MYFLVICRDAHGSGPLRRLHLQAHLDYVESIMQRIAVAGPVADNGSDERGEYRASCFIYRADSAAEARQVLLEDPYYCAGIYASYTVEAFKAVAGTWVGGRNW